MSKIGITRSIDNLGRIVIPKEYRDILKINEGDTMNINLDKHILTMEKIETSCMFCGSTAELIEFENRQICNRCCNKFLSKVLIRE